MKTKYIWLLAGLIGFSACNEEADFIDEEVVVELPVLTAGSADFSNYVALGASFTAGYTDGGLFKAGQEDSFPNTLAKQFANAGGGAFTQPLMSDNTGGVLVGGNVAAGYRLVFGGAGPVPLNLFLASKGAPVPSITTEAGVNIGSNFNNFGMPGAKSWHLVAPGYAAASPFYARVASAPTATVLGDAVAQNPTFFTLSEVGGNDVLGYATSGGDGSNPITDSPTFDAALNALVDGLTAGGAKGAVTNVPYITDLPHFTTVTHNVIPMDAGTAAVVNGAYAQYNGGIVQAFAYLVATTPMTQAMADAEIAKRTIMFQEATDNAVVIMDETLTDLTQINPQLVSMRQATADDMIVLPASTVIGTEAQPGNPLSVNGVAVPLADKWVLLPSEQEEIKMATDAYNQTIASVVASKGLALVDLNSILTSASTNGVKFDDFTLSTSLVTGGLVSLDGVHLTARGYAFMANEFLKAIDATYGSNFVASGTMAKAYDYGTNYSPLLQ